MPRSLAVKLRMILSDPGFIASVLQTFVLCSTASIYTDAKYNEYSAFSALFHFTREEMLSDTFFSSVEVLRRCGTGWVNLFLPITAVFAWARVSCVKRNSSFVRFELHRKNRWRHDVCEYLSGCISGGFVSLFGFLLFAAAVYLLYPHIRLYDQNSVAVLSEMHQMMYGKAQPLQYAHAMLSHSARMFAYGFLITSPVLAFAPFSDSPYTLLCLPFFLIYAYNQFAIKFLNEHPHFKAASVLKALQPGSILAYLPMKQVLIPQLILTAFCFGIFTVCTNLRRKKGDCL